jgi:hypothetical protein
MVIKPKCRKWFNQFNLKNAVIYGFETFNILHTHPPGEATFSSNKRPKLYSKLGLLLPKCYPYQTGYV